LCFRDCEVVVSAACSIEIRRKKRFSLDRMAAIEPLRLTMKTFMYDLRFSLRQLRKNPGMTILAVLTLALGIGANAAIFTVIEDVILRPLPYRDSNRLVFI